MIFHNKIKDNINEEKVNPVVIYETPPLTERPKRLPLKKPNKGNNIINKNIFLIYLIIRYLKCETIKSFILYYLFFDSYLFY